MIEHWQSIRRGGAPTVWCIAPARLTMSFSTTPVLMSSLQPRSAPNRSSRSPASVVKSKCSSIGQNRGSHLITLRRVRSGGMETFSVLRPIASGVGCRLSLQRGVELIELQKQGFHRRGLDLFVSTGTTYHLRHRPDRLLRQRYHCRRKLRALADVLFAHLRTVAAKRADRGELRRSRSHESPTPLPSRLHPRYRLVSSRQGFGPARATCPPYKLHTHSARYSKRIDECVMHTGWFSTDAAHGRSWPAQLQGVYPLWTVETNFSASASVFSLLVANVLIRSTSESRCGRWLGPILGKFGTSARGVWPRYSSCRISYLRASLGFQGLCRVYQLVVVVEHALACDRSISSARLRIVCKAADPTAVACSGLSPLPRNRHSGLPASRARLAPALRHQRVAVRRASVSFSAMCPPTVPTRSAISRIRPSSFGRSHCSNTERRAALHRKR